MAGARDYFDRDIKLLYALSGNECANPSCSNKLVYPVAFFKTAIQLL